MHSSLLASFMSIGQKLELKTTVYAYNQCVSSLFYFQIDKSYFVASHSLFYFQIIQSYFVVSHLDLHCSQ